MNGLDSVPRMRYLSCPFDPRTDMKTTRRGLSIVLATCCLAAGCDRHTPARAGSSVSDQRVDRLFAQIEADTPGCATGVAKHGETIFMKGFGLADVEAGTPIASETVFRVASVSKMFTAAAVLLLVQDGVLSLDDDVRAYLVELPDYGVPVPIRRLLNHTGGLPEYETLYFPRNDQEGRLDYDSATRADQLAAIVSLSELTSQPGERYAYTNTAYLLLALIVERVSGMSLQDFAQMRLFGSLAMMDTAFRSAVGRVPGDAIPYHRTNGGAFEPSPAAAHIGPTGLQTSVRDLLTWGKHLASGTGVIEMMQTHETLNDGTPVGHGYGVFLRDVGGSTLVFHPGGTIGVSASFAYLPDTGTSVAILCNRDDLDTLALAVSLVRIYRD